ncbi:MAG: HAD family hydrolase [archaeon YNP-WB-040]|jgi:HAD superfamily hydrolase (TIGR01549 family)|nr:HAD family hydrolase [Candidatus Culexarchaeum yellowstonense]
MIKAVFVDFWRTLVAPRVSEDEYFAFRAKCLAEALMGFGYTFDFNRVLFAHKSSRRICDAVRESYFIEVPLDLELKVFLSLLDVYERGQNFMASLRNAYMRPLFNLTSTVDGAYSFLKNVRGMGFMVGLISNVYTDLEVFDVLKRYGLYDFFDSMILSYIVGFRKPKPEIFKFALNSLHVNPDEAVMVGDDYNADIMGALNIGMKAIWFTNDHSVEYPFKADNFNSILNIIVNFSRNHHSLSPS